MVSDIIFTLMTLADREAKIISFSQFNKLYDFVFMRFYNLKFNLKTRVSHIDKKQKAIKIIRVCNSFGTYYNKH